MEISSNNGVRKGAWTYEEDSRLRKCVEQYGEGKWHQVPIKAGLKRCRKSCRLRWLNYLKPSIKRGGFEADEVDLIIRLHKLLGNRWSLIAGRLPGRTANDIKNHWNTHLRIKKTKKETKNPINITKPKIVSPRPQSSKNFFCPIPFTPKPNSSIYKANSNGDTNIIINNNNALDTPSTNETMNNGYENNTVGAPFLMADSPIVTSNDHCAACGSIKPRVLTCSSTSFFKQDDGNNNTNKAKLVDERTFGDNTFNFMEEIENWWVNNNENNNDGNETIPFDVDGLLDLLLDNEDNNDGNETIPFDVDGLLDLLLDNEKGTTMGYDY